MRERPIIFSSPMVRAILGGRKTMTRRVVKNLEINKESSYAKQLDFEKSNGIIEGFTSVLLKDGCPYGIPGDRLWVRETFAPSGLHRVEYRAFPADGSDFRCVTRWLPSIHMPRWASRITIVLESVRVERLQEISAEDCLKEGIPDVWSHKYDTFTPDVLDDIKHQFQYLWDSINGKKYPWSSNPLVWCISFKRG